jgi:uncharacterized membrane protein YccC
MRWRLLPLLLLVTACAPWWMPPPRAHVSPSDDSERVIRRAEAEAQAGAYAEAARLFEEVLGTPNGGLADRALIGLTRVLVYPDYAGRDYAQAYLVADRLQREHPSSPFVPEARAWQELLSVYLKRNQELSQLARELAESSQELERRTRELERLQHLDQELERRTQELKQRTQELEQLKRLDQELERLTHELAQELERRNQELQRLKRLDLQLEQPKKKP